MKSKRVKNILWIASEKGAYLLTSVVSFLFFAWYLSPGEFGMGLLCISIVELLGLVITSFFDDSMVRRKVLDDDYLSTIFWLGLIASLVMTLFLIVVVWIFSDGIDFLLAIAICSLKIPLIFLGRICIAECRRNRDFRLLAKRTLLSKLIGTVVGVVGATVGLKELSLVFQVVSVELVSTAMLIGVRGRFYDFPKSKACIREIIVDGFPIMIKYVAADAVNRGMIIILGIFSGAAALGIYGFAYRLVELPKGLIQNGVLSYALPAFSNRVGSKADFNAFASNCIEYCAYFFIGIFFILGALSDSLILLIFSQKWAGSIAFAEWLYISSGIGLLAFLGGPLVNALGKNKKIVTGEFFVMTVCLLALLVFAEKYGALSAVVIRVFYFMAIAAISVYVISVDAGIKISVFFNLVYRPIISGVLVLATDHFFVKAWPEVGVAQIFSESMILVAVFVLVSVTLRKCLLADLRLFLNGSSS